MKKKQKKNNHSSYNPYSREAIANVNIHSDDFANQNFTYKDFEKDDGYPKKSRKKSVHAQVKKPSKKLSTEQENMLNNEMWLAEHRDKLLAEQEEETFGDDRKYLLERQDYLLKENKRLMLAKKETALILEDFNIFIKEKCGENFEETYDLAWKKDNYDKKRAEFEKNFGNNINKKLVNCENTKAGNETLKKHNDFLFKLNSIERNWIELARMTCEEQIQTVKRAGFKEKSEDMLANLNHLREKQIERENPRFCKIDIQEK